MNTHPNRNGELIGEGYAGSEGMPGSTYEYVRVKIRHRKEKGDYFGSVKWSRGSNQGYLEEHDGDIITVRAKSLEAIRDRLIEVCSDLPSEWSGAARNAVRSAHAEATE